MTASTTIDGTDFGLVCDTCGQTVTGLGATMHNWDLVWSLFSRHGWTGTRLATGPHSCARCSRVPLAAVTVTVPARCGVEPSAEPGDEAADDARVRLRITRGVPVVELSGDVDATAAGALREALATAGRRPPHVVIDLAQAKTLDSAALAELVTARHRAAQAGGHACLVGLPGRVSRTLHTLCLRHLFVELPDRESALAWLRGDQVPQQRLR
ncbi:STAS domain-containing protein [Dactylosporangium roseum]|uniref:STAS domain-containing protein n=1 Tax=Dactylosporangium roseum TaxID=47989 RepID=A0ABY5YY83_9ACTN|nr:STAS domain-containing protein [Dactylosporangium roseum]UWZ33780.1 STAS domain-containing protein [Dactylosporangium roseum]